MNTTRRGAYTTVRNGVPLIIKVCNHCGQEKPVSAFRYLSATNPDRGWRGRCRECERQGWHERYARTREERLAADRERYRRKRTDPEWWAMRREQMRPAGRKWRESDSPMARKWREENAERLREHRRRKLAEDPTYFRADRVAERRRHAPKSERMKVPAAPFAAWLAYVIERDDASILDTAARLGIADRLCRRIRDLEQKMVSLDTVERALIADGTIGLDDLYPDLSLAGT